MDTPMAPVADSRHPASNDPIERARSLIELRYDRPLDVQRLARAANLSTFHFIRAFRQRCFETPHRYLMRRRIERAKELLANSGMSVTDICFEIGFESLGSFSSLFRREVGWPPSAYRARVLQQRARPEKFIPHCFRIMFGLQAKAATGG